MKPALMVGLTSAGEQVCMTICIDGELRSVLASRATIAETVERMARNYEVELNLVEGSDLKATVHEWLPSLAPRRPALRLLQGGAS